MERSLELLSDAEHGRAYWASLDDRPNRWNEPLWEDGPLPDAVRACLPQVGQALRGPAPYVDLAAPRVEVLAQERTDDGTRRYRLHIRSARGASVVRLAAETRGEVRVLQVSDKTIERPVYASEARIVHYGASADGIELVLEARGNEPIVLHVVDQSRDLFERVGEALGPRPEWRMPDPGWRSDSVFAYSVLRL